MKQLVDQTSFGGEQLLLQWTYWLPLNWCTSTSLNPSNVIWHCLCFYILLFTFGNNVQTDLSLAWADICQQLWNMKCQTFKLTLCVHLPLVVALICAIVRNIAIISVSMTRWCVHSYVSYTQSATRFSKRRSQSDIIFSICKAKERQRFHCLHISILK